MQVFINNQERFFIFNSYLLLSRKLSHTYITRFTSPQLFEIITSSFFLVTPFPLLNILSTSGEITNGDGDFEMEW